MDDTFLIKEKINIVDLIQEYIPLKKAGVNFKANCPFHQEHTPSFMVSPERGIFHCFGCGVGGDHFKFLMEKEGIEFKEAIEILAKKAGIELKHTKKEKDSSDILFEINQKAQQFFTYMLTSHLLGKGALDYLKKRGLTDQTIKLFGLGYAPLNWETLSKFLKKRGFSEADLIACGIAVPSKQGCYDRFRGRIIFPLIDTKDKIIGFAGRVLGKGEPKYINTPQTVIFDKSKFLFGLNLAKSEIRQKKEAIIVEGEMDMIASYQAGVKNIVASKGTALTEKQIELLKKSADTILLCFDADLAGDAASRRGIELADKQGLSQKVVQIIGGKDPAELCLIDPKKWEDQVKNAIPIYDYYLKSADKRNDFRTTEGKQRIFSELLPIALTINDPIRKDEYIRRLSELILVNESLVRKELAKIAIKQTDEKISPKVELLKSNGKDGKIDIKDRRKLLEEYLIALLLHLPESITYIPNFPETLFTREDLKQIYVLIVLYLDQISFKGKSFKISEFIKFTPEELINQVDKLYLILIDEKLENPTAWQKEIDLCISELKKMLIKASLEKLSLEIKQAQSFDKPDLLETLNKRFRDLAIKLKSL